MFRLADRGIYGCLEVYTTEHIISIATRMRLSQRETVKFSQTMNTFNISSPGRNNIMQSMGNITDCLHEFFQIQMSDLCEENGGFVRCNDLPLYFYFVTSLAGKSPNSVEYFKFNADEGQGKLQVTSRRIGGLLETSIDNIVLVTSAPGCKETHESTALLFNSLDIEGLHDFFPNATIIFSVDMKMQNLICGLGPNSCRFPTVQSLFSPNIAASREDVNRTILQIIRDYNRWARAVKEEVLARKKAAEASVPRRDKIIRDSDFQCTSAAHQVSLRPQSATHRRHHTVSSSL